MSPLSCKQERKIMSAATYGWSIRQAWTCSSTSYLINGILKGYSYFRHLWHIQRICHKCLKGGPTPRKRGSRNPCSLIQSATFSIGVYGNNRVLLAWLTGAVNRQTGVTGPHSPSRKHPLSQTKVLSNHFCCEKILLGYCSFLYRTMPR